METIISDLIMKLKKLNSKRLGLLFQNTVVVVLFTVLYFMIAIYLENHYDINHRIIRYAALPIVYFLYTFLKRKKNVFNQLYNEFIIEDIIRGLYPSWSYNKESAIDEETIYQTFMVKKGSSADITNNLMGDVGNTNFNFVELKVLQNQYVGARLPKKLFHGYFFIFDNNKITDAKLYVRPHMLNDFGSVDFKEKKIQTDSIEFDQRFATFSDDPVMARYILTPALMSRILDFESKFKNKISLLFHKDKLYIAFKEYKNLLEPSLLKGITVDSINRQMDIFKLLGFVVEELNIDNNIWLKESKVQGGE